MKAVTIRWSETDSVPGRFVAGERGPAVLLAHGAGVGQDHELMVSLRDGIAAAGFAVMTFDYPYMAAGKKRPDHQTKLLTCHRAATATLRELAGDRVVLAGRSMGGRMGTYLAAEGEPCDGLILYSYPLHPAGRPEKLRADHLPSITQPILALTGTRDAMATQPLYDEHVDALPSVTTHWLEDADHSYRVRKTVSGRTKDEVVEEIIEVSVDWLGSLPLSGGSPA